MTDSRENRIAQVPKAGMTDDPLTVGFRVRAACRRIGQGVRCRIRWLALPVLLEGISAVGSAQGQSSAADWADQLKTPASWFRWGADLRLRNDSSGNPSLTEADPPGHSYSFERLRLREWNTFALCEHGEANLRFTWEGRHYWQPASKKEWDESDIIIDSLNAKVRLPNAPITVIAGRQDITFGEGWLISDATPLDGPRTFHFEALRTTIDLARCHSTLDLIYLDQAAYSDRWLPPIFNKGNALREQNERGFIAYLSSKAFEPTQVDAYAIYKRDRAVLPAGDTGEVYTLGARLNQAFTTNLAGRIEGAYQFGRRQNAVMFPKLGSALSAWGLNSRLTYFLRDRSKQRFLFGYEVRSGGGTQDSGNHQFDPLWGRWAQFSELYPDEFDRPSDRSNLHRLNLGHEFEPMSGLLIQTNYHALFAYADRKSGTRGYSDHGTFKGHLLTTQLRYDLDRHWSGLLLGEYFIPGDYYAAPSGGGPLHTRNDPAWFVRAQVVFSL